MNLFQTPSVNGISLPRRRFTGWAVVYFMIFLGAPILGLALVLDVIFYLVFTRFFETCYGVLCLLI
jgi:hypothetical protein